MFRENDDASKVGINFEGGQGFKTAYFFFGVVRKNGRLGQKSKRKPDHCGQNRE